MRGAERPAKVHWTHPFLLPLQPLSDDAARQTFVEITDNVYDEKDIAQILRFTDNMPLVVDLIAHLADYEGLSNVLARWETERTALISVGMTGSPIWMCQLVSLCQVLESHLRAKNY
ncbi:hypothetical protein B0H14DRAFT_2502707 [Mycena olivaceomarginata]|nr:hypothetical protein B0H14DRAFT_2502707 [Mycena olivaceomarginata]